VQYVGSVKGWTDPVYVSLASALSELDPKFGYSPRGTGAPQTFCLHTEGQTDVTHLSAALDCLHERGEFLDLDIGTASALGSDSALKRHLAKLPATRPGVVTVCLFDRDNEKLLREEGLLQDDYVDRGNGVVAAAVVAPEFRVGPVCIEMLYSDEHLRIRDGSGRRMYLRTEFNVRTGQHESEQCNMAHPKNETLVREDVFEFGTAQSLALSKMAFADAVAGRASPFDRVSFDGFRPTFEMLREATKTVAGKVAPERGE
jgi:RNA-directed DNA polymerase